ncbi:MAG: DUF3098 domain-containing protein [Ignavibacteriae bacterium]|nr:DUF3098 domain-containing protein [Ignavibacteriota bacterium]
MAKAKTNIRSTKKAPPKAHIKIAFTKKNYMILGLGIAVIILGYILMAANSVDGFLPTTVAPILLVAGYCVIIPFGILFKDKEITAEDAAISADKSGNVTASNIKTN